MSKLSRPSTFAVVLAAALACAAQASAEDARVIIKLREPAPQLKHALAAEHAQRLSSRLGIALSTRAQPAAGVQALRARGISTAALLERLAADPEIEYAVADEMRRARALPNDPLYADQWYLQSVQPAATRAESAWDTATGSDAIVMAVIDTGVRPEHPDLAARMLAGYDFISEAALAGDGDGRDGDASDSGDFIDHNDQASSELQSICGTTLALQPSSWHGTRVAGVLAAAANNSQGLAGMTWSGRILPLRVLGKCGGFDSDIVSAMRWAGGLNVPGVPANPTPARVLNLSLGGPGACTQPYRDAIQELRAAGVLVVASAGNETSPVESPGNCAGVLAVAGVRHIGTKVGYSSLGPEVGISAPAGNCVSSFLPCLFPINTTSNAGSTQPGASIYTDGNDPNIGTSFSAPQVAGVAGLMLGLNAALTPDELIARIKSAARPFPVDATIPTCPATASGPETTGQCNCTTATCGAGLLDAAAALAGAAPPVASISAPAAAVAGSTIALDASASQAASGRQIVAWQWRLVSAPAGASLSTTDTIATTLQAPSSGTHVIGLVVTDDLGASDEAILSLAVADAASPPPPGNGNGGNENGGGGGSGGGAGDPATLLVLAAVAALALRSRRAARQQ